MKKVFSVAVVLILLVLSSNAFAYDPGAIKGADVEYYDGDQVTITKGYGDCYGKAWSITSEITEDSVTDPNTDDFIYIYLDYSTIEPNKDLTTSNIYTSTDEPAWNDNHFGWYHQSTDTEDRCIGAVWWDDTTSNSIAEFGIVGNKTILAENIDLLVNGNPSSGWQFTSVDADTRTPVNAAALLVSASSYDSNSKAYSSVRSYIHQKCTVADWGYTSTASKGWIYTGTVDRSVQVYGESDDENYLSCSLHGWEIER